MAVLINGINGPFRGKAGSVVGYVDRYGQGIIRGLPRISKARTQKQLDNQKRMKVAQQWLKPILPAVRIGFKNYSRKQHGFGSALSYLKLNAIREDFTVDPSRVLISWGDLPIPASPGVTQIEPGILEFTWEPVENNNDHVMVVAHSDDLNFSYADLCGATRRVGKQTLKCTTFGGHEADLYIAFITEERDRCSNSVYLGRMLIE
ncbi:MAG TPA: DUF6266 family protein [Daejeonella sp.]